MVKIDIDNLDEVKKKHYDGLREWVNGSSQLIADLFLLIGEAKKLNLTKSNFKKRYLNLNGNAINGIAAFVLKTPNLITKEIILDILRGKVNCSLKPEFIKNLKEISRFLNKLASETEVIINADPLDLERISLEYKSLFPTLQEPLINKKGIVVPSKTKYLDEVVKIINYIFDYIRFSKGQGLEWSAYNLTQNLGINTCSYCNRNYTLTVIHNENKNKGIIRPQLDHFLSQTDHPLLALSFFNLIPSCSTCNSNLKGAKEFSTSTHLHPYLSGFLDDAIFSYKILEGPETKTGEKPIEVIIKMKTGCLNETSIEGSCEVFYLEKIYNLHADLVQEMIHKKKVYNDKYIQVLRAQYEDIPFTDDELYRLAFGTFLDEKEFSKRPMSKFQSDIAKELGMI